MKQILLDNPLILLFVIAAIGHLIGNMRIKRNSLGVAAVLFTGLVFGALEPDLEIPDIVFYLGLSIFVYSIGLSSGPAFFNAYKQNGIRDFFFIFCMLTLTGFIAAGIFFVMDLSAATVAGLYAGSTTNTPALAGLLDHIGRDFGPELSTTLNQLAVVGFSWSYPMGVLGSMIAIVVMERVLKIDYAQEKQTLKKLYPIEQKLTTRMVKITNPAMEGITLRDWMKEYELKVTFGRIEHEDNMSLAHWGTTLSVGDSVFLVGDQEVLDQATALLGERANSPLQYDRSQYDSRRIFLSNRDLAGHTLASLQINEKFNAIITRIRRGDTDMLATGDTVLRLGDRIRFIAKRSDLTKLSKYLGDSYQSSSKIDIFSYGIGIALGLILGSIPISFGDFRFQLGYAGGPLIVGLLLGALGRTGKMLWTLPYGANVTLQQLGLILVLAYIGVRSGAAFGTSLSIDGLWIFLASAILSILTAVVTLWIGKRVFKMPFSLLLGMVSNQPAILDFAQNRTNNSIPQIGFSMIFPIALIAKIAIAQLLFIVLH